MSKISDLIDKYIMRNGKSFCNNEVLHSMGGEVLLKSHDMDFKFEEELMKEVKEYCENEGYSVDRVIFFKSFDSDMGGYFNRGFEGKCESRIVVSQEEGQIVATVFFGGWLKLKK